MKARNHCPMLDVGGTFNHKQKILFIYFNMARILLSPFWTLPTNGLDAQHAAMHVLLIVCEMYLGPKSDM